MPMLWMFAAAALAAPAQAGPWAVPAVAQASVSIRIISGVTLKLDAAENADAPRAHDSMVKTEDGQVRPARLIEFQ